MDIVLKNRNAGNGYPEGTVIHRLESSIPNLNNKREIYFAFRKWFVCCKFCRREHRLRLCLLLKDDMHN